MCISINIRSEYRLINTNFERYTLRNIISNNIILIKTNYCIVLFLL